jgi:tartrate-resistant acid phosphatase type 5
MIYIFGDIGHHNDIFYNLISNCHITTDDIVIFLGDNFYPNGIKDISHQQNIRKISDFIKSNKCYAILGNHDYMSNPMGELQLFDMPYFYYNVVYKDYHLIFIDTQILVPNYANINRNILSTYMNVDKEKERHIQWLDNILESNKYLNKKTLIFGHYPIATNGMYKYLGSNKDLANILIPIMKKYNIKDYVSGHDHNLQYLKYYDTMNKYEINQYVSGSSSSIHKTLKFMDRAISSDILFYEIGFILIDNSNNIQIINNENKQLYRKNL